jgi:hypothetical protein
MSLILETDSGSAANISSELAIGEFTATAAQIVAASVRLSNLNGAAALFTMVLRHKSSGGTMIREVAASQPKRTDTDAVFGFDFAPGWVMASGEKIEVRVVSTNASDTNVTWAVDWIDRTPIYAADVNAQCDTALADYDAPTKAEMDTAEAAILAKLLKYFQLAMRKDTAIATDNATEVTAINADGGSGAGAFANTTDAQEAIRDNMVAPDNAGIAAIQAQTDLLTFTGTDVKATLDGETVALTDASLTGAKFDASTAFPLTSVDSGATQVARTGADSDTLETLSDQMDDMSSAIQSE